MRSGWISIGSGRLWYTGVSGYYWPNTAASMRYDSTALPSAYNLNFNVTSVNPLDGPRNRWYGFPLRWLKTAKNNKNI